ncbi:MAG: hypothetical protein RDV48_22030 [Candidatus Eremiobacteraeota bacterium]|nr:hypothetical protein [Candidatus Eremiobacteraeota bacterium]
MKKGYLLLLSLLAVSLVLFSVSGIFAGPGGSKACTCISAADDQCDSDCQTPCGAKATKANDTCKGTCKEGKGCSCSKDVKGGCTCGSECTGSCKDPCKEKCTTGGDCKCGGDCQGKGKSGAATAQCKCGGDCQGKCKAGCGCKGNCMCGVEGSCSCGCGCKGKCVIGNNGKCTCCENCKCGAKCSCSAKQLADVYTYPASNGARIIAGKPSVNGPNLIIEMDRHTCKTVVLTGNTLFYPSGLDPAKAKKVNVKYVTSEGLCQALEVYDAKYSWIASTWSKATKSYLHYLGKKKLPAQD